MKRTLRYLVCAKIVLIAALWSCFGSTSSAWAQNTSARNRRLYDACCQPVDYWIVSSRCCPQGGCGWSLGCPLDYFHFRDGQLFLATREEYLASFRPEVRSCFMIHGSFVAWNDVRSQSLTTYHWLRSASHCQPMHVVFFTWCSNRQLGPLPIMTIEMLGQIAEFNGLYLAQLLAATPSDQRISLIGHSHGTRTVLAALHSLQGGMVSGRPPLAAIQRQRVRVVLAAAAVDHDWLNPGRQYGLALSGVECLVNLRNRFDTALAFYPLLKPLGRRALARSGFTYFDRLALGMQCGKIAEWDVTQLVGTHHMWPHYVRHQVIARSIAPYLFVDETTPTVEAAWSLPVIESF